MDIFEDANRERQSREQLDAAIHRRNVAGHLVDIVERDAGSRSVLVKKKVGQRRLSSLDLAREDGFLSHITVEKLIRAGQQLPDAVEPAECHARRLE